tara:strand:- start:2102 stop:2377 length:276 start_codon:yes stop_codon:yes gene_type:complete
MTLTKQKISKKIKDNSNISNIQANQFLNTFIDLIKKKSESCEVKIHNFGSFVYKPTPKRIGRNPKTGKKYIIKSFNRLVFRASFRLKNFLN